MNRIMETFGVSRVLLPVVHPVEWDRALENARLAGELGVKGVFLINQGMSRDEVLKLVLAVRRRNPSLWVGVNLLGCSPAEALRLALEGCEGRIDGIWSDNAQVDERATVQRDAEEFVAARRALAWNGLYFGGVAFKYQRAVSEAELGAAAALAARFMDVVCTSGPGTGMAASGDKLAAMRGGLGPDAALALASGVTAANVADYVPHVDAFLVGTGIEASFGVLDPEKVAALHALVCAEAGPAGAMVSRRGDAAT